MPGEINEIASYGNTVLKSIQNHCNLESIIPNANRPFIQCAIIPILRHGKAFEVQHDRIESGFFFLAPRTA